MRIIFTGLVLLGIAAFAAFTVVITAPYYYYHRAIHNKYQGPWYSVNNYREILLSPSGKVDLVVPDGIQDGQWRKLQFGNAKIPIPIKNPFFIIVPILNYNSENKVTQLGLEFIQPNGLVLNRVIFLPRGGFSKDYRYQKIFKLPLAVKLLENYNHENVWRDLFTKDITSWNIPYEEMIYNLYLLHKRSKLIHPHAQSFGLFSSGELAQVKVETSNKDFQTEIIYKFDSRTIFGILIQSRIDNQDASKLRSKFINDISFEVSTPALTSFIYQEFQRLGYDRQTDHEGLAYLMSAWSHDIDNEALVRAMVGYMERGEANEKQLKPLYEYASERYNTTFSTKNIKGNLLKGQVLLNQKIELEKKREQLELERLKASSENELEPENLTPKQKLQIRIQDAKKQRQKEKSNQMIMN